MTLCAHQLHEMMRTLLSRVSVVILLFGLVACTSTSNTSQKGVSSSRIELAQLPSDVSGKSAYQVVKEYKSHWLQKRGASSINSQTEISVYLDTNQTRFGNPESLKQIQAVNVQAIEWLDSQEATFRYGLDNTQGVILVHMKRGTGS